MVRYNKSSLIYKLISVFLTVVFILLQLQCISAFTAEKNSNVAEAFLGESLIQEGFEYIEMGNAQSHRVGYRNDEAAWIMDNKKGKDQAYLNIKLQSSLKPTEFDGSEYEVEVDYYDSGKGYLRVFYDSIDLSRKIAGTVYTNSVNEWKTAKFTLQDALFQNRVDGKYDIVLSIRGATLSSGSVISKESIAVKRVKVTRLPQKNGIHVSTQTNKSGNSYKWFDESKILTDTFVNYTNKPTNVTVTRKFISEENICAFEKTTQMAFAPGESRVEEFDFGELKDCGIYKYHLEIKSDDGSIDSHQIPMEVIVLKTDPDGIRNDTIYYATHLDRYPSDIVEEALNVMELGNIAGVRMSIGWANLEPNRGFYTMEKVNSNYLNGIRNRKFKMIASFGYVPRWLNASETAMPMSEDELDAFRGFVEYMAQNTGDVATYYQLWNEPNVAHFNSRGADGKAYAKMAEVASKALKKHNPNAQLTGTEITNVGVSAGAGGREYTQEVIDAGGLNSLDALSLHPYTQQVPEKSDVREGMALYKEMLAKAGKPDYKIIGTEDGYTIPDKAVGSEEMKGAFLCRKHIYHQTYDITDSDTIYNFEKKGTIENDREDQFGSVYGYMANEYNGKKEEQLRYGKYFVPTISYLMVTAMNYVTANSKVVKAFDQEDGNVRMTQFRSDKFNKDLLTLYTVDNPTFVSLNLGTDKVKLFDKVGNETEIYGENGVFTFKADKYPKYILGDFKTVSYADNCVVNFASTEVSSIEKNDTVVNFTTDENSDYSIKVTSPLYAENISTVDFNGGNTASVKFYNNAVKGEDYPLLIDVIDKNGKIIQRADLDIVTSEIANISLDVSYGDATNISSVKGSIEITNNSANKALRGKLKFSSPSDFAVIGEIDIGNIPRNKTGIVEFSVPQDVKKGRKSVFYDLKFDTGEIVSGISQIDISISPYAHKKPVIDGVLSPGEWNFQSAMYADTANQTPNIVGWTKDDVWGRSGITWDESGIYIFAEVTDNIYFNDQPLSSCWSADSMQIGLFYGKDGFIALGDGGTDFTELGLAKDKDGKDGIYVYSSQGGKVKLGELTEGEIVVKNNGLKTVYEFQIPWNCLIADTEKPAAGNILRYSFIFNDNDGTGRKGWIECGSGIGSAKDSSLFMNLLLAE